jgi:hypothetical protein
VLETENMKSRKIGIEKHADGYVGIFADGRWQMADGRWQIEVYFKALKIGCRAEQLRLEKRECLEPALAFYMIIAWCVLFLTMLGCDCPEMP